MTTSVHSEPAALIESETTLSAILAGVAGITTIEVVQLTVNRMSGYHWLQVQFLLYGEWMFSLVTAWVLWISLRIGPRGILIAGVTFTISFVLLTQFRGLWVWNGTFDRYEKSLLPLIVPTIAGTAIGSLSIFLPRRAVSTDTAIRFTNWLFVFFCGVIGLPPESEDIVR